MERILFNPNEAAILYCRANGGPNNTFLWFFNGEIFERATTGILNLSEIEGGEYTCLVSNIAGSENDSVILTGIVFSLILQQNSVYHYVYHHSFLPIQRLLTM